MEILILLLVILFLLVDIYGSNILANNFNANATSSNLIVGSDLTTGNLVMGSTNVSSNTTIVGGAGIDISSNGDINFAAKITTTKQIKTTQQIFALRYNAHTQTNDCYFGRNLTTGDNYFGSIKDTSSNTYIQAGTAGGIVKINNTNIAHSVLETDLSGGELNIEPDKYSMYFYINSGSGATKTLKSVDDSTGLTLELRKINSLDAIFINCTPGVTILPKNGLGSGSATIDFDNSSRYMRLISSTNNFWIVTEQY